MEGSSPDENNADVSNSRPANLLNGTSFNRLARARYGYMLYNDNDIYIGRSIRDYGEFSQLEVATLLQICREGDTVIEVGANIGTHTLPLARKVGLSGRVVAFEPQRIVFQALCANMALNDVLNVECRNEAAGEETKTLLMKDLNYALENNFGGISIDSFTRNVAGLSTTPVRQIRLDDVVNVPRCRLLKVDAEGMEESIIAGSRELIETHRPAIYCENDDKERSPSLIRSIFELGYRAWWHFPTMFNPDNFYKNPKNHYGNVVSANMLCIHESVDAAFEGAVEITDPGKHPLHDKS